MLSYRALGWALRWVEYVPSWAVCRKTPQYLERSLIETVHIFTACSWAVGTFVLGSAAMYEFCQRKRRLEREGMQRVVEVIDRKKSEKQKHAETASATSEKSKTGS